MTTDIITHSFELPQPAAVHASLVLRSSYIDGQPWFYAKDICEALGLSDRHKALAGLDDDEKGTNNVLTLGGTQSVLMVNESGLYALLLRSRKPQAKTFRKWVTSTVLPTLRRDGVYFAGQEAPVPEDPAELEAQLASLQAKLDAIKVSKAEELRLRRERRDEEREAMAAASRLLRRGGRRRSR